MTTNIATLNPFDIFIGLDGKPLNQGYVYIGLSGQDPQIYPAQLFWDAASTQPAAQPLRTLNGYIANGGAPSRIYVNGDYSLRVRDKKGNQVYSVPSVLLSSGFSASVVNDAGGFLAQLQTSAGFSGLRLFDQSGARKADIAYYGATNSNSYGVPAGAFNIDTPSGVPITFGAGDALRMTIDATTGLIGMGLAPTAAQGALQLLGSSVGGIKLGNIDNTYRNALDWYEEVPSGGTFTPQLYIGGLITDSSYSSQAGRFTRIGNLVFYNITVQINIKGSLTGGLALGTVPYAPVAGGYPCTFKGTGLNLVSPFTILGEAVAGGGGVRISLFTASALGGVVAFDTILANSCSLEVSGFYMTS